MEDVEKITHLTIQMEDKTVKEVLDACLKDTGLKYLLENNLIIIKKETVQVHPVVICLLYTSTLIHPKDSLVLLF